jgi:hypothetical protein
MGGIRTAYMGQPFFFKHEVNGEGAEEVGIDLVADFGGEAQKWEG